MLATNYWECCHPKKIIRIKLSSSGKFRVIFPHQGGVKKKDRQLEGVDKLHEKYNFTTLKKMFTCFGQNISEFYDKHILFTVLCLFWPDIGLGILH